MEVYDIYLTNINRIHPDHYKVAQELEYAINQLVVERRLERSLGRVADIKIPKNRDVHDLAKTCYGFVRMTRPENHEQAAGILNGQIFYDVAIEAKVNEIPSYFATLKYQPNVHVEKLAEFNSEHRTLERECERLRVRNEELERTVSQLTVKIANSNLKESGETRIREPSKVKYWDETVKMELMAKAFEEEQAKNRRLEQELNETHQRIAELEARQVSSQKRQGKN
jgi:hypothetical protein